MKKKTGRYSGYIRPFSYILDLVIINALAHFMLWDNFQTWSYHLFITLSWAIIGYNTGFYEVYRYTKVIQIYGKVLKQYFIFIVVNFAYIGYFLKFSSPLHFAK